jgi:hypothetical protein
MVLRRSLILPVLLVAACASPGIEPSEETPSMTDGPTPTESPTPTPARSLSLASAQPTPSRSPSADETTITGRLGFDSIEGGCPYLETDDGTRYQVLWPDGWRLDGGGSLVSATGETVAGPGDELTVRGRVADDMASICQIGPIFRASEVIGD